MTKRTITDRKLRVIEVVEVGPPMSRGRQDALSGAAPARAFDGRPELKAAEGAAR